MTKQEQTEREIRKKKSVLSGNRHVSLSAWQGCYAGREGKGNTWRRYLAGSSWEQLGMYYRKAASGRYESQMARAPRNDGQAHVR